ncbi:MAG: glycosyltransferase [Bacteroidales bacterium]|jgi:glycosyltransferase involved in cell wall biosynthesis|nr:glycosyltransferase [Bacteroidales bacterium]
MKFAEVSIVVANYNNSKYLIQFFDSIIKSSNYPEEIIFVDDCSTDDSIDILNTLEIKNLKLIRLPNNVGFSNALNCGIEEASCKYIMRVDPDDYIDERRIEIQYNFLENNPDIDVLGSNCKYYNENLNKYVATSNVKIGHDEIVRRYENGEHGMIHGTIMCRRNVLKTVKYSQENYPAEEFDIFSRMIVGGYKFHNLSTPLLTYRIHSRSVSNKMPFATVRKIYELNELYFKKKNSFLKVLRMFLFLRHYRSFLDDKSIFKRYGSLFICILVRPESILSRIWTGIKIFFKHNKQTRNEEFKIRPD